jgi:putative ubiquitin-RnfH superfamily antitoxin RatB of RatAB toxin-antitoxin module
LFGNLTRSNAKVDEGARVKIYREITADLELVERHDTEGENDDDT